MRVDGEVELKAGGCRLIGYRLASKRGKPMAELNSSEELILFLTFAKVRS